MRCAGQLQRLQAFISPHTMIDMDDKVASVKGSGFGYEVGRLALLARRGEPVAKHVGL